MMEPERRRTPRRRTLKGAMIVFNEGHSTIAATVRNLSEDGANLLAGFKRATNILKAEEKKGPLPQGDAVAMAGAPAAEAALIEAISLAEPAVAQALHAEDFADAMRALSALRAPVDAFFEEVLVNSEVQSERENRLRLLAQVRDAMGRVADFGQVNS